MRTVGIFEKPLVCIFPEYLRTLPFFFHKHSEVMSKICELSGKRALVGHHVSHSNLKTIRRFNPNLIRKKFFIPETGEWITLKIAASTLKTINRKGISACLDKALKEGRI